MVEERHVVDVGGHSGWIRSLVTQGGRRGTDHLLVSGYTLAPEIYTPICAELARAGHSARVVDPFTIFGLEPRDAGRVARRTPEAFMPHSYADRLAQVMDSTHSDKRIIWAESMGAHVALQVLPERVDSVSGIVLINPNGIRQNMGNLPGWPDRCATRLAGSQRLIAAMASVNLTRWLRRGAFRSARALVGGLRYKSEYLDMCEATITDSPGPFYSALLLPLLGINHDLLSSDAIAPLAGLPVTMILSTDDAMLRFHTDEKGRSLGDFRDAWLKMAQALNPRVMWVDGGHEAVFREGFDVRGTVAAVLGQMLSP